MGLRVKKQPQPLKELEEGKQGGCTEPSFQLMPARAEIPNRARTGAVCQPVSPKSDEEEEQHQRQQAAAGCA
jgi:hypothetical protein